MHCLYFLEVKEAQQQEQGNRAELTIKNIGPDIKAHDLKRFCGRTHGRIVVGFGLGRP